MSLSPKYTIGDLVKLKIGGPVMLIDFVDSKSDVVHCWWFEAFEPGGKPRLQRGAFVCSETEPVVGSQKPSFRATQPAPQSLLDRQRVGQRASETNQPAQPARQTQREMA